MALFQIRWSMGGCDTPFPFSLLSTPSAFWSCFRGQSHGVLVRSRSRWDEVSVGICGRSRKIFFVNLDVKFEAR